MAKKSKYSGIPSNERNKLDVLKRIIRYQAITYAKHGTHEFNEQERELANSLLKGISKDDIDYFLYLESRLTDTYIKYGNEHRLWPRRRSDIYQYNIIDASKWWNAVDNTSLCEASQQIALQMYEDKELSEMSDAEGFLFYVPCYPQGVILSGDVLHVFYNVETLDYDKLELRIRFEVYEYSENLEEFSGPGHTWGISSDFVVDITVKDRKLWYKIDLDASEVQPSKRFELASPKQLGFTSFESLVWKNGLVEYEHLLDKYRKEFHQSSLLDTTCDNILNLLLLVNYALYKSKPTLPKRLVKSHVKAVVDDSKHQKERRTRYIDTLAFVSVKSPRMQNKTTIRKYRLASWYSRGGVRKLKSGKLVPFKASIHHRKCLQQNNEATAMQTTKLV